MRDPAHGPAEHDAALAQSSHLPHVLASLCATQLHADHIGLAATGFRDTSRVAAGSAELWRDILTGNREQVLHGIVRCNKLLADLQRALADHDDAAVTEWLNLADRSALPLTPVEPNRLTPSVSRKHLR